jgi:hypothetical protein
MQPGPRAALFEQGDERRPDAVPKPFADPHPTPEAPLIPLRL